MKLPKTTKLLYVRKISESVILYRFPHPELPAKRPQNARNTPAKPRKRRKSDSDNTPRKTTKLLETIQNAQHAQNYQETNTPRKMPDNESSGSYFKPPRSPSKGLRGLVVLENLVLETISVIPSLSLQSESFLGWESTTLVFSLPHSLSS